MNNVIKAKLDEINIFKQLVGYAELKGCSDSEISSLDTWLTEHLSIDRNRMTDYKDFFRLANGLDHDGLVIYNIISDDVDSIYYMNEVWWEVEENRRYLFLGNSDISFFCFDLVTSEFKVLDLPSGTLEETYTLFDDMLDKHLRP